MKESSGAIKVLKFFGIFIPGDYLKTIFYLYFFSKPRKLLRLYLNGFYRMEHIYDVLNDVKNKYDDQFSILEFGTHEGYSLNKILYATKFLKMTDAVTVFGFDSFEGMPESKDRRDKNIIHNSDEWIKGQFHGIYENLHQYLSNRYNNFQLIKGYFEESIDQDFLNKIKTKKPVLIWIDCDYYSSAKTIFEHLIPFIPNGCYIYFDEYELNYGSKFTGEARLIHEINQGAFGEDVELVLDKNLSLDSTRIYRFVKFENAIHYNLKKVVEFAEGRSPTNGSPLP